MHCKCSIDQLHTEPGYWKYAFSLYNTSRLKTDIPATTIPLGYSPILQNVNITRMINQQSACMPPAVHKRYTCFNSLHISGTDLIVFDFSRNFNFQSNVGNVVCNIWCSSHADNVPGFMSLFKPRKIKVILNCGNSYYRDVQNILISPP